MKAKHTGVGEEVHEKHILRGNVAHGESCILYSADQPLLLLSAGIPWCKTIGAAGRVRD